MKHASGVDGGKKLEGTTKEYKTYDTSEHKRWMKADSTSWVSRHIRKEA